MTVRAGVESPWLQAMPLVFVGIWSTGFVVARYGMPHAPPLGFLAWRFALSVLAFGVWIAFTRPSWPQGRAQWGWLALVGVLMHAGYLGGVWSAIKLGLGAGTMALVAGLQPVLTALWVAWAGSEHRVSARQWAGLALGLAGLVLVALPFFGFFFIPAQVLALPLPVYLGALLYVAWNDVFQGGVENEEIVELTTEWQT